MEVDFGGLVGRDEIGAVLQGGVLDAWRRICACCLDVGGRLLSLVLLQKLILRYLQFICW